MKKNHNYFLLFLIFCALMLFDSCVPGERPDNKQPPNGEESFDPGSEYLGEDGHPIGWEENSHGKKGEPDYELLFGGQQVLRMDIVISPADWQIMLNDLTEKLGDFGTSFDFGSDFEFDPREFWKMSGNGNPIYIPCNLSFQGKTWYHVGLRFKGNSSLKTTWQMGSYKLPMRLTFDHFEDQFPEIDNQRFFGFKKLGLASNAFDNSLVREKVANELYRAAGIPVAHDAFCRVYIDYGKGKKYFGIYTLQEIPDTPMLKSVFMDNDGNLYKPDGVGGSFATWEETSLNKQTNEKEADFSDVRKLYDVLQGDRSDEAAFRSRLENVFNVDGFLRYLAVNQVICNWDTYGNLPHNYYLYHNPEDDLIHWIPWDFNFSMETVGLMRALSLELGPREVGDSWPLIRYLLDIPDYHARYVAYVKKFIDEVFYPERMKVVLEDAHGLIKPYVIGEQGENEGYSNLTRPAAFDAALTRLEDHVNQRYTAASNFVSRYMQ